MRFKETLLRGHLSNPAKMPASEGTELVCDGAGLSLSRTDIGRSLGRLIMLGDD